MTGDTFTARLQYLRERRRISRSTMSQLCGISKNMIGRYERGEQQPTLDVLITLANFFDVSIDYISGRECKR